MAHDFSPKSFDDFIRLALKFLFSSIADSLVGSSASASVSMCLKLNFLSCFPSIALYHRRPGLQRHDMGGFVAGFTVRYLIAGLPVAWLRSV